MLLLFNPTSPIGRKSTRRIGPALETGSQPQQHHQAPLEPVRSDIQDTKMDQLHVHDDVERLQA